MIIAWIYFLLCKIIGLTTKLLFKTDTTKELRNLQIENQNLRHKIYILKQEITKYNKKEQK